MQSNKTLQGVAAAVAVTIAIAFAGPAVAGDIVKDWKMTKAPKAPKLKNVTVNAKNTALVVMDLQTNSCNTKRRPRCLDTIPAIKKLIGRARSHHLPVVYSITSSAKVDMLLNDIKPQSGEPHVKASVDKFYGTDLNKILKAKGVTKVILVGTAAEGAVLGTATGAAVRGYKVIVPVDGMSSSNLYYEQFTAVYLTKAPGTKKKTTLTRTDMIEMK